VARPKDQDGATGFDAGDGETTIEEVAGVGVKAGVAAEFTGCGNCDVAEFAECRGSFGESRSHLANDLLFTEDDGVETSSHGGHVKEGIEAAEAGLGIARAATERVDLDALAALDEGDRGLVASRHGSDTIEIFAVKRSRAPQARR
jgi:hypothetical protein